MIFLLNFAAAWSQWYGNGSIIAGYDSNPFRITGDAPDFLIAPSLAFGYFPDESPYGISYTAAPTLFASYSERSYLNHYLDISCDDYFGENDGWGIVFSGAARHDMPEVDYYDYYQAKLSGYIKLDYAASGILNAGINARYRNYPNYPALSNSEESAFISYRRSFVTRTSIMARVFIAAKNYYENIEENSPQPANMKNDIPQKKEKKKKGNQYGKKWGEEMKDAKSKGNPLEPAITNNNTFASQIRANLRIAQSIGAMTGVSLNISATRNLTVDSRSVVPGTVDFYGEDELFDDPFSYEKNMARITLTTILFDDYQIACGGFYSSRSYHYPADFSGDNPAGRFDEMNGAEISVERNYSRSLLGFIDGVGIDVYYVSNNSNAGYFDYTGAGLNIGIDITF
jgi:hypothetical protein